MRKKTLTNRPIKHRLKNFFEKQQQQSRSTRPAQFWKSFRTLWPKTYVYFVLQCSTIDQFMDIAKVISSQQLCICCLAWKEVNNPKVFQISLSDDNSTGLDCLMAKEPRTYYWDCTISKFQYFSKRFLTKFELWLKYQNTRGTIQAGTQFGDGFFETRQRVITTSFFCAKTAFSGETKCHNLIQVRSYYKGQPFELQFLMTRIVLELNQMKAT